MRTLLFLMLLMAAHPAQSCRQALALGLDVSSSVSQREYEIQRDGLVAALTDPQIADMLVGPVPTEVRIMVFEWGDATYQRVLLPFTPMVDQVALTRAAALLAGQSRRTGTQATGIGSAMRFAERALLAQPCATLTLDLSGDGKNNVGPRPRHVRGTLGDAGITVNGLVVATRNIAEMSAYYQAEVIAGPFAFVMTAAGFEDYPRAIRRKLMRELIPPLVSATP